VPNDMIWQSRTTPPCPIVGLALRGAPQASSARRQVGLMPFVGVASAGVENGGVGRCPAATLIVEARRA
jgi:hypothetical protein